MRGGNPAEEEEEKRGRRWINNFSFKRVDILSDHHDGVGIYDYHHHHQHTARDADQ